MATRWFVLFLVGASLCPLWGSGEGTPKKVFAAARKYEERGDFKEAERRYREYLQIAPRSPEAHVNMGVVYSREGKLNEAIQEYQIALRINPSLHSVYLNLGIAYFKKEDFFRAILPLQKFLSGAPQNQQARELLGLSYVESDNFEEAIQMLTPLRASRDPEVLLALGSCYVRLNRLDEAEEIFQQLLSDEPNSPRIHYLLARIYLGLNNFPKAEKEFEQVHSLNPDWPQINLLLGAVEVESGQYQYNEAERHFRRELQHDPESFGANFALGALFNKLQRYSEALPVLEKARRLEPRDGETLYELAWAYWKEGRKRQAWEMARSAVQADSQNRRAHFFLGKLAQERGENRLARQEMATAESLSKAESKRDILRLAELSRKDHLKKQP